MSNIDIRPNGETVNEQSEANSNFLRNSMVFVAGGALAVAGYFGVREMSNAFPFEPSGPQVARIVHGHPDK